MSLVNSIEKVMKKVWRYRKSMGRWERLIRKFGKMCTSYMNRSCLELLMWYFQYRRNVSSIQKSMSNEKSKCGVCFGRHKLFILVNNSLINVVSFILKALQNNTKCWEKIKFRSVNFYLQTQQKKEEERNEINSTFSVTGKFIFT